MNGVSVLIPAFNEEKSIASVIENVSKNMARLGRPYEIIVINDGSVDKTAQMISGKNIRLINHPYNLGYGASLKTGLRNSIYDVIGIIDADGTYPADKLAEMIETLDKDGLDMVIGARVGVNAKIPILRRPAKAFLNFLAGYLVGKKIPDLNSGLRVFKKESAMKFYNILPSKFSFTTTITLSMLSSDYLVKFIPIAYETRVGRSKISPFRDTIYFLLLIFRTVLYFNPLKIFLPLAVCLFIFAGAAFFFSIAYFHKIADVTVIIIIFSALQILAIGLLADLIDRRTKS